MHGERAVRETQRDAFGQRAVQRLVDHRARHGDVPDLRRAVGRRQHAVDDATLEAEVLQCRGEAEAHAERAGRVRRQRELHAELLAERGEQLAVRLEHPVEQGRRDRADRRAAARVRGPVRLAEQHRRIEREVRRERAVRGSVEVFALEDEATRFTGFEQQARVQVLHADGATAGVEARVGPAEVLDLDQHLELDRTERPLEAHRHVAVVVGLDARAAAVPRAVSLATTARGFQRALEVGGLVRSRHERELGRAVPASEVRALARLGRTGRLQELEDRRHLEVELRHRAPLRVAQPEPLQPLCLGPREGDVTELEFPRDLVVRVLDQRRERQAPEEQRREGDQGQARAEEEGEASTPATQPAAAPRTTARLVSLGFRHLPRRSPAVRPASCAARPRSGSGERPPYAVAALSFRRSRASRTAEPARSPGLAPGPAAPPPATTYAALERLDHNL